MTTTSLGNIIILQDILELITKNYVLSFILRDLEIFKTTVKINLSIIYNDGYFLCNTFLYGTVSSI